MEIIPVNNNSPATINPQAPTEIIITPGPSSGGVGTISTPLAGPRGPQGVQGPQGEVGSSIVIKGSVPNVGALPSVGNSINDAYLVESNGHLYVWGGSSWVDAGNISGPQGIPGPTGPTGPTGPQGFTGATGSRGDGYYLEYPILIPSAVWTIPHNLGAYPNITTINSAGDQVEGDVEYTSLYQIVVSFSAAFAGKAILT